MNKPGSTNSHQLSIALIGNPNCGKTTIFNNLTGGNQKTGNWPGVTVEKKTGNYYQSGQKIIVTDLPGVYSLSPAPQNNSIDQKITNDFIINNRIDIYVNIIDASNLKRNLYLTIQLLSLGLPCLIIANMDDKLNKKLSSIDYEKLGKILKVPIISISSTKNVKHNTKNLKNFIENYSINTSNLQHYCTSAVLCHSLNSSHSQLDKIVHQVSKHIKLEQSINLYHQCLAYLNTDGIILQLLETNSNTYNSLGLSEKQAELLNKAKQEIHTIYEDDVDIVIADLRYNQINLIYEQAIVKSSNKLKTHHSNNKIDAIVLNKYLGIPIFFLILYSLFEISISLGEVLKPIFESISQYLGQTLVLSIGTNLNKIISLQPELLSNLSLGVATGFATVAGFIPQIALMFVLLTFLEDSGYMARAAFVMDRLMQLVGLPGKSFVPLIIGFGCNVPAILASRTLNDQRDRILTCLMTPFMSCSARLAIFIVFASAFFPKHQGLMVFILYLTGIAIALLTGILLKNTILTNKQSPFILELPSYNIPTVKNMLIISWQRCKGFIVRAGKLIIPICIILQLLNNIEPNGRFITEQTHTSKESSILATFSKTITPTLNPIGITNDNWPATIGLITGSLAKEVVIGTLNILYSDNQTSTTLQNNLSLSNVISNAFSESHQLLLNLFSINHYSIISAVDNDEFSKSAFNKLNLAFPSTWAAFAYCLFILLYIPCLSTFSILIKEIGKNWAIASLVWSIDIAYASATIVYQLSNINTTPIKCSVIISMIIIFHLIIYKYLKSGKLKKYFIINKHDTATA